MRFKRFAEVLPLHQDLTTPVNIGDYVMTESKFGPNIGVVFSEAWSSSNPPHSGTILHIATPQELSMFCNKLKLEEQGMAICRKVIYERGLEMDILDAEYHWNGEKLSFFFDSKKWVNYRSLQTYLQSKFQARVCMIKITEPELLVPCEAINKLLAETPL